MKFVLCLFSAFFIPLGWSCEINTYARIIKLNKVLDDSVIQSTNCGGDKIESFLNFLANASGTISARHLQVVLNKMFKDEKITLSPDMVRVETLTDILQSQLNDDSLYLKEASALHNGSTINLAKNEPLELFCQSCQESGRKNIKLSFQNKTVWVSARIQRKIKALKLTKSITYHQPLLTPKDFELVETLEKTNNRYFTDLERIQYYQINKNLSAGSLLKMNDLRPKKLISLGQKVNLHLKNKHINLKTLGIAQASGKYGEFIKIKNNRSSKIVNARVIDFNTAVVEL